jgi:hypothetical protein
VENQPCSLPEKPSSVIAELEKRGVRCENTALVYNWCEARRSCTPEEVQRKLMMVVHRGCERPQHLENLPLLAALGLDLFAPMPWPATRVKNDFTGETGALSQSSAIGAIFRHAPVAWLERNAHRVIPTLWQVPQGLGRQRNGETDVLSTLDALLLFDEPERLNLFLSRLNISHPNVQGAILTTLAKVTRELADGFKHADPSTLVGLTHRAGKLCTLIDLCDSLKSLPHVLGESPGCAWPSLVLVLAADTAEISLSVDEEARVLSSAEKLCYSTHIGLDVPDQTGRTPLEHASLYGESKLGTLIDQAHRVMSARFAIQQAAREAGMRPR